LTETERAEFDFASILSKKDLNDDAGFANCCKSSMVYAR